MLPSFVITFREVLEITLVVGVVLSYLNRTRQTHYNQIVYVGLGFGVVASIIAGFLFFNIAGSFSGRAEEIFEGAMMFVGAGLLTYMIFWMMRQKQIAQKIEHRVAKQMDKPHAYGLFLLVFVSVLREGIEMVIFLNVASLVSANSVLLGFILGTVLAVLLGYLLFKGFRKISIKHFFNVTSLVLIFFAAGLLAHGVHEFHEAHILPPLIDEVWNINPPVLADGSYPLMHDKGQIGILLAGIFGYNGNPSLLELLIYLAYLALVFLIWKRLNLPQRVKN